ncbi:DUF3781 domain-containing protein [Levilactobacillus brevis]|uniref:DUF3781 domain-containing protein n=1 Tax=Levilactobacillus hammesii TaxID=267633 RepID=A0A921EYX5_9LACO|nr:DUF3781 domain-containing protein [Levilactobacillus brevis]HJE86748.1 DUF3781 domain-containing protein [Levilactobacillus hammesii]
MTSIHLCRKTRTQARRELLDQIKAQVCYTELVYGRVKKKLAVNLTKAEVGSLVIAVLGDGATDVEKLGKNYYVTNSTRRAQLVINSFNYRLITANRVTE